jgi:cytochrome b involved in lipid metabolism
VERNGAGEVLLIIDGMVLDVTRWLQYHPGGQVVIPNQAINVDCVFRCCLQPSHDH